jgi:hypothetical protein
MRIWWWMRWFNIFCFWEKYIFTTIWVKGNMWHVW